jgi:hypothetical protein
LGKLAMMFSTVLLEDDDMLLMMWLAFWGAYSMKKGCFQMTIVRELLRVFCSAAYLFSLLYW